MVDKPSEVEYEVEAIMGKRMNGKKGAGVEYLVKWKDYT